MKLVWKILVFSIFICATFFVTYDRDVSNINNISRPVRIDELDLLEQMHNNNSKSDSVNETVNWYSADFQDRNFSYRFLKHPGYCDRSVEVLIIVLSMANNFELRETIRQTWGATNDTRVRINFLFSGHPSITNETDVIMTNLPDTYENLIVKVHSLLTYKSQFCANATYVLKIDEDAILNIPEVLARLQAVPPIADPNSFMCFVWKNALPKRDQNSKWYMPRTFWPSKYYPNYCNGPMYIIGSNVINKMLCETKNQKFWKLEDVFWTGVIAQVLGIRHFEWNHLHSINVKTANVKKCHKRVPFVTWYDFKPAGEIRSAYEILKNDTC